MKIVIETIPHDKQRYPTCGDWYYDEDGTLIIKVSELSDPRMVEAVAVHELFEALACKHAGISQESVDVFDKDFEANRTKGSLDEPGDSPNAPYYRQHGFASGVERIFATETGLDWNAYANEIDELA